MKKKSVPTVTIYREIDVEEIIDIVENKTGRRLPAPPVTSLYDVEIDYTVYPGTPGNYFGLPENCYPAEPAEAEAATTAEELADELLIFYRSQLAAAMLNIKEEDAAEFRSAAVNHITGIMEEADADAIQIAEHEEGDYEDDCHGI